MTNKNKAVLLASLAMLIGGCGPSGKAANQVTEKEAVPSASAADHAAIPATGLQRLEATELAAPLIATSVGCNIEALGKTPFATVPLDVSSATATISGWVLSGASRRTGLPAQLRFLNQAGNAGWELSIDHWIPRPDVISSMHGVDNGNAGFVQEVKMSTLPRGTYHVIVTFQDGGKSYLCDKTRFITAK